MNISVTIQVIELQYSVCNPNGPLEGMLSQNFDLGPSFHIMSKNVGAFFIHKFLQFIK